MNSNRANARCSGWSLIEVTGASLLLFLAVLGVFAVFVGTVRLSEESRENAVLSNAVRNVMETLRAEKFSDLATVYGLGGPREYFWCGYDSSVVFSDPGGAWATGQIEVFDDESAIPSSFADLGGGYDLDGDGSVSSGPVASYRVLPVRVSFDIVGSYQPRSVALEAVLTPFKSW